VSSPGRGRRRRPARPPAENLAPRGIRDTGSRVRPCRPPHLGIALVWLSVAAAASAQPLPAAPRATVAVEDGTRLDGAAAAALRPSLDVRTLANGLRVVLDPRPGDQTVTLCSVYDVGLANESETQDGFTRLAAGWLGDLDGAAAVVAARGGVTATAVGLDRTSFCTTVPARELALGVWAEARRLHDWALTPERLEAARRSAERLARAPAPAGARDRGEERLEVLALRGALRTERSAVAAVRGVTATRREEVERFVAGAFRPERGVLAVSGGFEPAALLAALGGALPPAPACAPAARGAGVGAPARQLSERFSSLREEELTTPLAIFGWVTPAYRSADQTALEITAGLLAGGPGTLLHDELVVRAGLARSVRAFTTAHRGVGLLVIEVELTAKAPLVAVESAVTLALRRLASAGPTAIEIARARAARLGELLERLDGGPTRALELATRELVTGDLGSLEREPERYRAVTEADVRRVVSGYLTETGRSVVEVYPPGWPTGGPTRAARRFHLVEPGDTLIGIAARYGVTVEALTRENSIPRSKPIFPGDKLRLPPGAKGDRRTPPSAPGARGPGAAPRIHVVKKGDTLGAIARRYGVTSTALARANGLDPKRSLRIGQKLTIPSAAPAATPSGVATPPGHPDGSSPRGAAPAAAGAGKPAAPGAAKPGAAAKDAVKPGAAAPAGAAVKDAAKPGAATPAGAAVKDAAKPGAAAPAGAAAKDAAKPGAATPAGAAAKDAAKPGAATPPRSGAKDAGKPDVAAAPGSGAGQPGAAAPPSGAAKPGAGAPGGAAAAPAPRVHVVRSGETLSGIARRYGVTTTALARANGLDPKRPIRPGQQLVIPE